MIGTNMGYTDRPSLSSGVNIVRGNSKRWANLLSDELEGVEQGDHKLLRVGQFLVEPRAHELVPVALVDGVGCLQDAHQAGLQDKF